MLDRHHSVYLRLLKHYIFNVHHAAIKFLWYNMLELLELSVRTHLVNVSRIHLAFLIAKFPAFIKWSSAAVR